MKTTWHIPKPMASLSRSLAPPTPKPSRPGTAVEEEPIIAVRATTTAPPPMRRHAQGILGVLAARLPLFVWSTDSALRVTSSLGIRPENLHLPEVQGPKPELRLSDRLQPAAEEHPALTAHRQALRGEAVEFDIQGDGRTFEVHIEPFRDTAGAIEGTVGVAFDVTERRRASTRLVHAVLHDSLTGLPNRTLFLERLRQALGQARRRAPARVAVLLLDIEGFKAVNHQLGHEAGDRFLVDVARRIEERLRSADTLARLEGDTFAVLLQDVEQAADAVRVARRVRENLGRPFVVAGFPRPAAASVGIVICDDAQARVEDVLHDAELALGRARAAGGGEEHVFDPRTDMEPAPTWPRLGPPATPIAGSERPASEAVLRWRPPTGQGTGRLRRLARAAGLFLPPRF